jgi:hypothetical protein
VQYFFNSAVYDIMWKMFLEPDRPQMTVRRTCIAFWIPKATSTHTFTICNTYCSSTASFVARTHLNVMLYIHTSPVLFPLSSVYILLYKTYGHTHGYNYTCNYTILIYSSFCALNFMLPTSRPNFFEVVHTIRKVEQV